MSMKIYIVGTGGVGGYIGGLLAKTGNDVTFVARKRNYYTIKEKGLTVKTIKENFKVKPAKVINSISKIKNPDLIIFTVKTYDTAKVAKKLAETINPNTQIVTFQNGIDNDIQIKKYKKKAKVYPGIIYTVSTKTKPGIIHQTETPLKFVHELIIGDRKNTNKPKIIKIINLFKKSKIDAVISNDIKKDLWIKFIFISAFSGITTAYRSNIGEILQNPNTKSSYKKCLKETINVAKKLKINIPNNTLKTLIKVSEKTNQKSKSSLLIDIENKRKNELESLTGKLVKLARKEKIDTPINNLIYETIKNFS